MNSAARKTMFAMTVLAVVTCIGWGVTWSEEESDPTLTATINGRVETAEYDADGNTLSVYVWDAEYGDVLISREKRGRELVKLAGSVIQATGDLRALDEEAEFDYVMNVESFEVVEPAEE